MTIETTKTQLVRDFYAALAAGDRDTLEALIDPAFVGHGAEGMPFGIGGAHDGAEAMRRNFWGVIARNFEARAEADEIVALDDGRLLVTGRYRGKGRNGGGPLDAAFAHLISTANGRITSLSQFTDTARWQDAARTRTLDLAIADGVATLRLNRPDKGNAINEAMAYELLDMATEIAERDDVRAILIAGNGPNFTVGGDVGLFAKTSREDLPKRLRRMIDRFHLAIEKLTSQDAPIVAAVRGGIGGGGLGLLYVSDIVLASDTAQFALGYGRLGLTADGGNTWFLPRLVGMQRAKELFLLNRRLNAQEAADIGLVSRVVADDALDAEAAAAAATLAAGPTNAYGKMRRLLRQSFETSLADQLNDEVEAIVDASRSDDVAEGIAAFVEKRPAVFRGK
ncbi:enoyl-CoA hydratase-related protein [Amorphus sp. 3PC139-8]|uniref:enoyl-CoA hydratase-related protein n=1 Tax=Amorphus sp. 3PC139-8 TaxID=2735676 RepID=UPI00345D4376